jgi:hypothetical protein
MHKKESYEYNHWELIRDYFNSHLKSNEDAVTREYSVLDICAQACYIKAIKLTILQIIKNDFESGGFIP